MSSFYLKQCLRVWFIHKGTLEGVEKSIIGARLKEEFKGSRNKSLSDFIYKSLGYKDDSFLTATSRFNLRKEIMLNINNQDYWKSKKEDLGAKRTSEVIEEFERLNVIGLGMERISNKTSEVSFKGLNRFVKLNKELVDLFCSSYSMFNSSLVTKEGSSVSFSDLRKTLGCSSYREFVKLKTKFQINPIDCFNLIESSSIFIDDEGLHLPSSEHQNDFICECLLFLICLGATYETLDYYKYFNSFIPTLVDIFSVSDKNFTYLVDLSFLTGKTLNELCNVYGFNVEDLEYMIKKTQGVYTTQLDPETDLKIRYLPSTSEDPLAIASTFSLDKFILLINSGMNLDIIYQNGIPHLDGVMLNGGES